MKAISLWQPWASLVALGEKQWETRSRQISYRGPIAIHAAKKWNIFLETMCRAYPFFDALKRAGYDKKGNGPLPFGQIVAVADLTEILTATEWMRRHCKTPTLPANDKEYCFGDYSPGRFAWKLERIQRLQTPIPYRGGQFIFSIDAAAVAEIERQAAAQSQATAARRAHAVREYELFRDGSGPI